MWSHPGKKLLFMGCEIAQEREWNHDNELDWFLLDDAAHAGIQRLVRDLNRLYRRESALHARDCEPSGFRWLIGDDRANSVFAYLRVGVDDGVPVLVVCNMTPTPRHDYRVGVPRAGAWREIMNTDSQFYGGSNVGNEGTVHALAHASHGEPQSITLTLPPLSTIMFRAEA
jgi:1,4-alpha-glucan branching enzyme